jgi:TPR repeat protein
VAASSPVRADYRSAVSAYENGAYEAALGEFRPLAQSGDLAAQYHLGLMFKDGRGVQKDPVTALGWFICAAGSDGQVGTDAAGSDGQVGADAARSAEQLSSTLDRAAVSAAQERARSCRATAEKHALARSGDPAAQYHLGLMFKDGRGVQRDPVTALGWFICAAGSDGQVGADAARSAEQLSSTLDRAAVSAAQERARSCRATAETPAPQRTVEESERPDIAEPLDWETFKAKLSRFFQKFSLVEVAGLESGNSFFSAPIRRSIWSRAFFLPADGTLVGSQHVAWELGARDLYRDLRGIARNDNNIALGLFAVLWWLLIGKTLLSMGGVLMRVFRRSGLE